MNRMFRLCRPVRASSLAVGLTVLMLVLFAGTMVPLSAKSMERDAANDAADSDGNKETQQPATPAAASDGSKMGAYNASTGFEIGYRWNSDLKGSEQMYRSQVNLNEGVRLLNFNLSLRGAPGIGIFDRMDLSVNNWGDPYNTLRFIISRTGAYDFRASYRHLNYFNFIPSIDNPQLEAGNLFAPHNQDISFRMADFDLRLFPNHKIFPFVGYSHNHSFGPGYSTYGFTGNEFLTKTNWNFGSDEYRGGIQVNTSMLNLTLERGYQFIKNDTRVSSAGLSAGFEGPTQFLGQTLTLNSLDRSYHSRLKLPTTKVLAKFTPFKNLYMVGRYVYSMADMEGNLGEARTGGFVTLENFLAYSAGADSFSSIAKKPSHNGSFLINYSPDPRLILSDAVDTSDYHITGSALLSTLYMNASSLFGPGPTTNQTIQDMLASRFVYNQVRNQADAELSIGGGLSAHFGHRYEYVEVSNDDSEDVAASSYTRKTGIVGMVFHPGLWLRLGVDYEYTRTNAPLIRVDPLNSNRVNVDWRIGPWKGIRFNAKTWLQHNRDAAVDVNLKSHNLNYSGGMSYDPNERLSVSVDFSRSDFLSDMLIVIPQTLTSSRSLFDERVSGFGGRLSVGIYKGSRIEMGYRGVVNRGSYPVDFHQPFASLLIPLGHRLAFKPTWQYFGYSQNTFGFENYQRHQVTFGLVYTR